jgi:mannose-6-phosphate isomerase-like protein (cupin superfamily)
VHATFILYASLQNSDSTTEALEVPFFIHCFVLGESTGATHMTTENNALDRTVQAVELYQFDGTDVWQEGDERARIRGYFPLSPGMPNASETSGEDLMLVCIEIEPVNYLPSHRDSNEELLLVTAGTVEATIGDESVELSNGECAVVPEMVPHGLRNVGETTARIIGFFPNTELTATFEKTLMPFGTNVVTIGNSPD